MQVLKSIVRRLQSRQVRPAQVTTPTIANTPVPLTDAELKLVAGGLPRAGGWGQAEEVTIAAALPRDA